MITEQHIDEAIAIAEAGGRDGRGYNQAQWCGTACCVLGWARIVAGEPEAGEGPRSNEIEDTPRGRTLGQLMFCPSPDILKVMRAVDAAGSIRLQGANLQRADLQGANLRGANLQGANLQDADLRRADLQGANLQRADLQDANLLSANLQGANLLSADLQGADLWRANLQDANLQSAVGVNLAGAIL